MKLLIERVKKEGKVIDGHIVQVSSFLNHQVDPRLMYELGKDIAARFKDKNPTKVVTVETSGVPVAAFTALELGVPFIIAKKFESNVRKYDAFYGADVYSYTKQVTYSVRISRDYISADDRLLIVDDFLAHGKAVLGILDIIEQAGASLVGAGICIEKSFQPGAAELERLGVDVYSQLRIKSLDNGMINI